MLSIDVSFVVGLQAAMDLEHELKAIAENNEGEAGNNCCSAQNGVSTRFVILCAPSGGGRSPGGLGRSLSASQDAIELRAWRGPRTYTLRGDGLRT